MRYTDCLNQHRATRAVPTVRRAFSLVELLVVIGLIVILIAILVPVVGRAREAGKRTACSSNLRRIGQAIAAYAAENKGELPRVRWVPGALPQLGTNAAQSNPFDPVLANDVTAGLFLLIRTQNIGSDLFVCPSAEDTPDDFAGQPVSNRSNFTDYLPKNLSYSYSNPYPTLAADKRGYRMSLKTLNPDYAVAADMSPGITLPTDNVRQTDPKAPRATIRQANSNNHRKDGQNVLYSDGRVEFRDTPFCGVSTDNIYMPQGPAVHPETFAPNSDGTDSVLIPDDDPDTPPGPPAG